MLVCVFLGDLPGFCNARLRLYMSDMTQSLMISLSSFTQHYSEYRINIAEIMHLMANAQRRLCYFIFLECDRLMGLCLQLRVGDALLANLFMRLLVVR
jgi:hypothetical protein